MEDCPNRIINARGFSYCKDRIQRKSDDRKIKSMLDET